MKLNRTGKIILIVIVALAILLTAILILDKNENKAPSGSSTVDTSSTGSTADDITASTDTNTDISGETSSSSDISNPPSSFVFSKILRSNTSTPLNIRIELTGELREDGNIKVTAELYLEHRSIYIGSRNNCRMWIGDSSEVFTMQPISCDSDEYGEVLIATVEKICKYKDTLNIGAQIPCKVTYSGIQLDMLEIIDNVVIE